MVSKRFTRNLCRLLKWYFHRTDVLPADQPIVSIVSGIANHCLVCGTCSLKRKHSDWINTDYTGNIFHILSGSCSSISINCVKCTIMSSVCGYHTQHVRCSACEHVLPQKSVCHNQKGPKKVAVDK